MSTADATPASPATTPVATPTPAAPEALNPAAVVSATQPNQAAAVARTTVQVTMSPEAYAHFAAAAKAEHRTLPNYMFVRTEKLYQQDKAAAAHHPAPASAE